MTAVIMEIPRIKWEKQRKLDLDKGFRDALRDICRGRWPQHTAKNAANAFDLTVDQGRSVANGSASLTTIEQCIKEAARRGDASVGLSIIEEVMGVSLPGLFRPVALAVAREAKNAVEDEAIAEEAWSRLRGDPPGPGVARRSWASPGEVGASEAGSSTARQA